MLRLSVARINHTHARSQEKVVSIHLSVYLYTQEKVLSIHLSVYLYTQEKVVIILLFVYFYTQEKVVSDADMNTASIRFPYNTPSTKEVALLNTY